jgi:hypothetical protein
MITGACLCGAVRYELDDHSHQLTHCHCSMCRKHHGAPFATFVDVEPSAFRWLAGGEHVLRYPSSPSRVRCSCDVCGSVLPELVAGRWLVPAGNLLGDLGEASGVHVFVGSKPGWHVIADAWPQHEGAAPGGIEVERLAAPLIEGATRGSCLCGGVSFRVHGAPARWMQCHCSRCRRGRSAAHGSNAFYPASQFGWLAGRDLVQDYKVPEAKRFMISSCTRCGGSTPVERETVPFVLVPVALLDSDPGGRPEAHIHVASKATWYTVYDDLPQFAELPPS